MADTTDSKSVARKGVRVQVPPRVLAHQRTRRSALDRSVRESTRESPGQRHPGPPVAWCVSTTRYFQRDGTAEVFARGLIRIDLDVSHRLCDTLRDGAWESHVSLFRIVYTADLE